jgi:hypothetical protein
MTSIGSLLIFIASSSTNGKERKKSRSATASGQHRKPRQTTRRIA